MPGANESSTVEWQSAHWMPTLTMLVVAVEEARDADDGVQLQQRQRRGGVVEVTSPAWICRTSAGGSAVDVDLQADRQRGAGVSPGPTPPFAAPAIAWCSLSASPQNASSPNVSKRKMFRPFSSAAVADSISGSLGVTGCLPPSAIGTIFDLSDSLSHAMGTARTPPTDNENRTNAPNPIFDRRMTRLPRL